MSGKSIIKDWAKASSTIETHKHQCDSCGTIWEHPEHCFGDTKAHQCPKPKCGQYQWRKYGGRKPADQTHGCCELPINTPKLCSTIRDFAAAMLRIKELERE